MLFVTTELFPWVKQGGLGDVSDALPKALRFIGLDVRLLLPAYPALQTVFEDARPVAKVPTLPGEASATVRGGRTPAQVPLYLLDAPQWFDRPGGIYDEHGDSALRWGALCRAAAAFARRGAKDGWRPQVVHAHDWQTGLLPAYLRYAGAETPPSVFTIHNLSYQGLYPPDVLPRLDLPPQSFSMHGLEFHGQLSFMKAGLYYSHKITTVSPTYAREIQTPQHGAGLEGLLHGRRRDLTGILNGVDDELWNPRTNPAVSVRYGPDSLGRKQENQPVLCRELGLEENGGPLFCVISRLVEQKGLDLLMEALPHWVDGGGRLAVLGTGDPQLEQGFTQAAGRWPGRVAVRLSYDEPMAVRLLAGSDGIFVPSRREPCGLTQLYGLAFGTLPLVRCTGGLADTVTGATPKTLANDTATGFVFTPPTAQALCAAMGEALDLWHHHPASWRQVQLRAMAQHFDWNAAAMGYEAVYQAALG